MGIIIRTGIVRQGLLKQNTAMREIVAGIALSESKIRAYIDEGGLEGEAFDAHKAYMEDGHLEFLGKYRMALEETMEANNKHINVINTELSSDYYNEAKILEEIEELRVSIESYDRTIAALESHGICSRSWEDSRSILFARRNYLREKLERLYSYIDLTADIYSCAEGHFSSVNEWLTRLELATRCAVTLKVSLPTIVNVREHIAIMEKVNALFDAEGNLDYRAVGNLMSRGYDNLTRWELDALTMLFGNPDICHMDLARAYQFAYSITPPENFWDLHAVLATITNRLADGFMRQVGDWLWTGAYTDGAMRESIEAQMHRIQMLAFIKGLGNHGAIKDLTDHLELDFAHNRIQFLGIEGTLSRFEGLFNGEYINDAQWQAIHQEFADAADRNPDLFTWFGHALTALALIPKAPAIIGGAATAHGITSALLDVLNALSNNPAISPADQQLLVRMLAHGTVRLGGGVLSINMNNGNYMLLGTTLTTQEAMIKLAGLEAQGISEELALAALADRNHDDYGLVHNYVLEQGGGWSGFENELNAILASNHGDLSTRFPDLVFGENDGTSTIPLPVLDEVIRMWREQNG